MAKQTNHFVDSKLREACEVVFKNPNYDGETHHAELIKIYKQAGASRGIAILAATIQSGYYPNWLRLYGDVAAEITEHLKVVSAMPGAGTVDFKGWNYPW